jgi:hypothetical protein
MADYVARMRARGEAIAARWRQMALMSASLLAADTRRYRLCFIDATSVQDEERTEWRNQTDDIPEEGLTQVVRARFLIQPSDVRIEDWDGEWVDFAACFSFEAATSDEIREEAERLIYGCGRVVDVFSVLDEMGTVVLTEEEL